MANRVPCYQRPETEVDEAFILEAMVPSLQVIRAEIKSRANPETVRVMRRANDVVAGHPRPEWNNLCSEQLWGHLMDHAKESGARLLRGWQLHYLDSRPDRLATLRACAAELMYRWKEVYGVYLTAQVALDVMTVRVIDETWKGYIAEQAAKTVLPTYLPRLAVWAGYDELFLRLATTAEDNGAAVDRVVEDRHGNPVIGLQVKGGDETDCGCGFGCPAYFFKSRPGTRFHGDKVKNIAKNNRWMEKNPSVITVRYISGNDLINNRFRTIRNDRFHEVAPAGVRLNFRQAAKGALSAARAA